MISVLISHQSDPGYHLRRILINGSALFHVSLFVESNISIAIATLFVGMYVNGGMAKARIVNGARTPEPNQKGAVLGGPD